MPHPTRLLTNDGSHTLHSERYGQTYHSTFGAVTEAQHVFLNAAGVNERLQLGKPTRILEIGFGLGLNALLSLEQACQCKTHLEYHAYEHALVPAAAIEALNYASLVATPTLHEQLLQAVDQAHQLMSAQNAAGIESLPANPADVGNTAVMHTHTAKLNEFATLTLHLGDATTQHLNTTHNHPFHAIYLDAFSPDANAECWSPEFMRNLASVLDNAGKLSTYSAKGDVRRAMLAAQLCVEKRPGPPGKREFLVASYRCVSLE